MRRPETMRSTSTTSSTTSAIQISFDSTKPPRSARSSSTTRRTTIKSTVSLPIIDVRTNGGRAVSVALLADRRRFLLFEACVHAVELRPEFAVLPDRMLEPFRIEKRRGVTDQQACEVDQVAIGRA